MGKDAPLSMGLRGLDRVLGQVWAQANLALPHSIIYLTLGKLHKLLRFSLFICNVRMTVAITEVTV
jgi:hypothetical protein